VSGSKLGPDPEIVGDLEHQPPARRAGARRRARPRDPGWEGARSAGRPEGDVRPHRHQRPGRERPRRPLRQRALGQLRSEVGRLGHCGAARPQAATPRSSRPCSGEPKERRNARPRAAIHSPHPCAASARPAARGRVEEASSRFVTMGSRPMPKQRCQEEQGPPAAGRRRSARTPTRPRKMGTGGEGGARCAGYQGHLSAGCAPRC
jgi:hypothetical protein